jgi:hypothetical protein
MKSYPTIPHINHRLKFKLKGRDWLGFDKLDGSLIRAEYSQKKGFYKFGRRTGLLDDTNPFLKEAPELILEKYAELPRIFKKKKWQRVIAFFEFFGPNSFAGSHQNEPHVVQLIDLSVHPKGFVNIIELPNFMDALYYGPINDDIKQRIIHSTLSGMTFEGVVFKRTNRRQQREMVKLKSNAWFDKLRNFCDEDSKMFERLR